MQVRNKIKTRLNNHKLLWWQVALIIIVALGIAYLVAFLTGSF